MTQPRTLRPVPDPLGSYLRIGRDHKVLLQMLVDGRPVGTGLVADPCLDARQADVRNEARRRGVEVVFDPRTLELSTEGGFTRAGVQDLPWAGTAPHAPQDLAGAAGTLAARQIATAVAEGGYSGVLAPTHLLGSSSDPWVGVDASLTRALRSALNEVGRADTPIYYPLQIRSSLFVDAEQRQRLISSLRTLPIDAIWLRVHPFGTSTSGPLALQRYLDACQALHTLGVPLVAEHSGTVGVALLAFGAVGGIESGITLTERVNFDGFVRRPKPDGKGFAPQARVYLHEIGGFLAVPSATSFFEQRGMKAAHGCHSASCCPRGWRDTLHDPRPHFVASRSREVAGLTSVPESLRAGHYLENFLRPASDKAMRAAQVTESLEPVRARLDSWRGTLGARLASRSAFTTSPPAAGHLLRRSA